MSSTSPASGSSSSSSPTLSEWAKTAKDKILNLNTSDDDLIKYVTKEMTGSGASEEKRMLIQQFLQMRSNISAAMSNALRMIMDAAKNVIGNLR